MATPYGHMAAARAVLVQAGIAPEDAALDAEVLARHALAWDRARLLAHGREPAPPEFASRFQTLIARRARREPLAQIVGHREFWGLDFEVTPDVLIPRPETELVVEEALAFAREHECRTVVDVGTGSGCIAIAVAHELPHAHVAALDRSEAALAVARRNAAALGVEDRVSCRASDLLSAAPPAADLILANLPYVPEAQAAALQPEVVQFEPHSALFAEEDGLGQIRRLLRQAPPRLAAGGRLIIEFGLGQAREVTSAATAEGWVVVRLREDLQGIARAAVLALEKLHV